MYSSFLFSQKNPIKKVTDEICHIKIFNDEIFKDVYKSLYVDSDLVFKPREVDVIA